LWRLDFIGEVNEELPVNLPEGDDFDTIGGFVFHEFGEVPQQGERLELPELGLLIIVEKLSGHRIEKLRIIIKESSREEQQNQKKNNS
jgi:CBS domain containing-hemolysin-like protein